MSQPSPTPLLEVRGITKRFPGVVALSDVHLTLHRGEVLAVIGENGAGKSTLMKILAGIQLPDAGEIRLDGRPVRLDSVPQALEHGVVLIHQELNLADNLSVGANVFLGREPRRRGLIDEGAIDRRAAELLHRVGLDISPRTLVSTLTIGRQQLVEIAKALSTQARVLIMDEPTSSLSQRETQRLFRVVRDLRDKGVSIVYISHRLGEVKELADRVLVLRDGRHAGELARHEITHDAMVKRMVGRDISRFYQRRPHTPGDVLLEVRDLVVPGRRPAPVRFSVRRGEVVGLAGLVGAGRTELLQVLFGLVPPLAGEIRVAGKPLVPRGPRDAIRAGLALVPEDRKAQGLILEMAVRENIALASLWRDRLPGGLVNMAALRDVAATMIQRLRIRTPGPGQLAQLLSGGNQQKIVLAKWLALRPQVLLLDEPTRGIDVGAKEEIYGLIDRLAGEGIAVLFASSEMEEILGISDRVLVMHEGRLQGELARQALSEEAIMRLATGTAAAQPAV